MAKEVFRGVASWFVKDQAAEDVAHGFPVSGSRYNSGLVMAALRALSKLGIISTKYPRTASFNSVSTPTPAPKPAPRPRPQ